MNECARNPERQVDTPEVIPAEKVCFEGMNESLPEMIKHFVKNRTRKLKLPH
ncbi:hypothetical protein HanPSC8_Chr08g0331961 [Helianthus annuus]|nr:hypothetical protein HanPSC8_Chr08g0331961 [Helianthus annuus]